MSIFLTYTFLIAAVVFGTASNILAKEAEGFSKIMKSDLVETLGIDTENARTASALLYIHLYEYIDKKFGK